jgi:hypothetical protein
VRLLPAIVAVGVLLARPAAAAPTVDDFADFWDTPELPRLAVGPVRRGSTVLSFDLGWLRSGPVANVGLGASFDLAFRASAFLLHDLVKGQNEIYAGVRYPPLANGTLRLSVELGAGQIFIPQQVGSTSLTELRGEVVAGLSFRDAGLLYARGAARALRFGTSLQTGWGSDGEVGLGYELGIRRFILGAEASAWLRPGYQPLAQWRLRVGLPL